jgi:hypothetical protein
LIELKPNAKYNQDKNHVKIEIKFPTVCHCFNNSYTGGVVVVVIVWYLDLQLRMQSVPITTNVVSSNPKLQTFSCLVSMVSFYSVYLLKNQIK